MSAATQNTGTTGTGRFIQYELQFRTPAETYYLITCEDGSQFEFSLDDALCRLAAKGLAQTQQRDGSLFRGMD